MMILLLARAATAEDRPANLVLADLGLHVIGAGYQRTLAPWIAAQVDVDFYSPWTTSLNLFGGDYAGDVSGFVLRVRPVFFLQSTAPDGWWVSPFAQAGPATATRDDLTRSGVAAAAGASGGYAGRIGPVHLSVGLGGQYHSVRIASDDAPPSFSGLYPTIDGTVGYAF